MAIKITKKAKEMAERFGIDLKEVKGTGKDGRILQSDIEALVEETDEAEEIIEVVDDEEDDDWGDEEGDEATIEDDDDDWGEEEDEEPKAGPKKGKYTTRAETKDDQGFTEGEAGSVEPPAKEDKTPLDEGLELADSFGEDTKEKKKKPKPEKEAPAPDPEPEPEPEFSGKTHTLYFEWASVEPDANAYKPLKPLLSPMNAGVRIDVPEEYVAEIVKLDRENEMIFLTPEGMAYCASLLAQATKGNEAPAADDPDPDNWDDGDADDNFDDWADEEGLDDSDEGWDD